MFFVIFHIRIQIWCVHVLAHGTIFRFDVLLTSILKKLNKKITRTQINNANKRTSINCTIVSFLLLFPVAMNFGEGRTACFFLTSGLRIFVIEPPDLALFDELETVGDSSPLLSRPLLMFPLHTLFSLKFWSLLFVST